MCTVTIIPIEDGLGFRLVTNRDESPDRARASAPRWMEGVGGGPRALWPIDGLAGGTWIAAGEQGLALAILNGNPRHPAPAPHPDHRLSRGGVIPRLMRRDSASEAVDALDALDLTRFEPFRLVAVDALGGVRVIDAAWDGRRLTRVDLGDGPACFASSGLGDWLVEPRLPLFEELVVRAGATPEAQDAFHEHRWPDRPEISVMMERRGARTVSVTRATVRPDGRGRFGIAMSHEPVGAAGRPAAACD